MDTLLDHAAAAYYAGEPLMSDRQFDTLATAAGRRKVGGAAGKIEHPTPMLSLRREDDPAAWVRQLGAPVICSVKIDGMAARLTFRQGRLVQAVSRGDGKRGCDITAAVADSGAVATGWDGFTGEVRGELFCTDADRYASCQSRVAAVIRSGKVAGAGVQFIAHDLAPRVADWNVAGWTGFVDGIPSDGIVVAAADPAVRRRLGDDGYVPLWAIAVKPW
jgi:NAD-dependent DNA ligase